ncbi:MAG: hypothetical protein AB1510_01855 [Bacillota bacterium]
MNLKKGVIFLKRLVVLLLAGLLAVLSGCGAGVKPEEGAGVKNESPELKGKAPAFEARVIGQDKTIRFPDDFAGRPAALIFFSTG